MDEHISSEFTAKHVCTPSCSSDFALSEADSQFCGVSSYLRSPCCIYCTSCIRSISEIVVPKMTPTTRYAVYIPDPSRIKLECFTKGLCTKFKVPFASGLQRVLLNKEHIADWRPTRLMHLTHA